MHHEKVGKLQINPLNKMGGKEYEYEYHNEFNK